MGALIAAHDWWATPLGPVEGWSQSLKTSVGLILRSGAQLVIFWGPDFVALYNDAYAPTIGNKHPRALGRPARESWSELWDDLHPLLRRVYETGQTVTAKDRPFYIERHGYPETVYFDISYSAVLEPDGRIGGILCIVSETTQRVLSEGRQAFRLKLEERFRGLSDPRAVMDVAVAELGDYLGAARVGYSEVREDGETIDCGSCFARGVSPILGTFRLGDFGRESVDRQRAGATEIVPDVLLDPAQVQETWAAIDTRAFVSVPLVRNGALLASLYVNFREPHRWSDDEVTLIEEVAARTWAAVEQVRAERALWESEARLRGVFESDLVGIAIFDLRDASVVAINDCFLALTGYSRAEYEAGLWDWRDVTPAEELEKDKEAIAQAMERGWWDAYEKEYRLRDGTRLPVRISSAPFPGQPGQLVISVQDISATRAAEAELRDSERRLQLAKTAAGLGVWDWDLTAQTITWSPEMYEVLGIDPDIPPDRRFEAWLDVLHPDDRERALAVVRESAETGQPFSMDFRIFPRGREMMRWVRSQAVAVLGRDGRPVRLAGVNLDVTAEHRMEEQLREKAESLAVEVAERTRERNRMYELSSDLFASAGFDGFLRTINPACQRLLGYSEADLLARPFGELIHPADRAASDAVIERLQRGEAIQRFENRLVRADGESVWLAWTAVPEGDRFHAVGRDVTLDKEREDHLRQSQKMEAVGQLTGGIAHDFNNVLGAVLSGFELIRRKAEDPPAVRQIAESGLAAAERGAKLTSQLLTFSRAQRIELRPVLIGELIEGMRELLQRTLGPMHPVEFDLRGDCRAVRSDPTQLEMAILNLAINARDAMPEGGTVRIATRSRRVVSDPDVAAGDYLDLSVSDTGVGMSAEVMSRAFDPFFTTKEIGKGTGLGLSQVYGIARQAGGVARIRSRAMEGTTVALLLPCVPELAVQEDEPESRPVTESRQAARVLVIDDDEHFRGLIVSSLESLGHSVTAAADGHSGLEALERFSPDVLLLDYAMPGLNGARVAEEVRQRWPELPIVFASGYSDTSAIEKATGSGAPMLRKPFRLDQLQDVLSRALDQDSS